MTSYTLSQKYAFLQRTLQLTGTGTYFVISIDINHHACKNNKHDIINYNSNFLRTFYLLLDNNDGNAAHIRLANLRVQNVENDVR